MPKTITAIITIIVVAGAGYWTYQLATMPEKLTEKEQACVNSGGQVSTSLCCKATGDFPNLCLVGPCGCSPENSHEVNVCDCGTNKCFNGNECISLDEVLVFLESLEQETEIVLSELEEFEFTWIVKTDPTVVEQTVIGKGFKANVISSEQFDSIHPFFINGGFKTDVYNFTAGTISELRGYKKDQAVCVVEGGLTGYKEAGERWVPTDTNNWDITVKCGKLQ